MWLSRVCSSRCTPCARPPREIRSVALLNAKGPDLIRSDPFISLSQVHRPRLPGSHLPSTLGAVPLHDPVRDGAGWVQHAPDPPVPVYLSHVPSFILLCCQ